jgi:hypothetical protein
MPRKRQSLHRPRTTGDGRRFYSATTDRVEQIESDIEVIRHTLDVQMKRIAVLQAEVDVIGAKVTRR